MRQETIKLIAGSQFVGFTMERLDKRYDILTNIISDPDALDTEIEDAARKRKEVRACIDLFIQEDVDDPRATAADILEILTGQSLEKLQKQTAGGVLAQDILEKTSTGLKIGVKATKKSTNSFATWLANITK
jgi:hypothetical protein